MVSINNSTPIQPTVPVAPVQQQPPVETTPSQTSTDTPADPAAGEAAPAEAAEAADTSDGKTSATETQAATPDLVISKEMAETLSSNQIQGLIDGILADNTVDKLDDDRLKQLNTLLKAAAQKNDGQIDGVEDSIIDALDSRGMFGTNREVVKTNLQALRKHDGEANSLDFSGSIQLTTQDGVSGFFGGKQVRSLKMEFAEELNTTAPTSETGETSGTQSPVEENSSPAPATPALSKEAQISEDARNAYMQETLAKNSENEAALKEDLNYLKNAFSRVPDATIQEDIKNLVKNSDTEGIDTAYIQEQIKDWGITLPENIDPNSREDMKTFLETYDVTPENVAAYREKINQVIDKAVQESPLSAETLRNTQKHLYDTNYIFENKDNVAPEDYQRYAQFKENLLDYKDSENRVRNAAQNDTISTTNIEVDNRLLGSYNDRAIKEVKEATTELNNFLTQVEKSGQNVSPENLAKLKSQLAEIAETDANGDLVLENNQPRIKEPITQEHLETLNKMWASAEAIGMDAGLDKEPGEITEAYFNELRNATNDSDGAVNQWNEIQKSPSGQILSLKPELAQYAGLLEQIEKNPELKAALYNSNNPDEAVNQLLAEHNTAVFNETFSSLGSLWNVGPMSYLTSWGCALPGLQDTSVCSALPSQSFSTDLTADATTGLITTPKLSLSQPSVFSTPPSSTSLLEPDNKKLELGQYTTQDVRNLLDLLKDPVALEGQTEEEINANKAQQVLLRNQLSQHAGDIANFIDETPELAGLRQQLDAKEAFDKSFWGDNSELDQAQKSIKTLLSKQDRVGSDLAVAEAQLQEALNQAPNDDIRANLQNKLQVVQQAQNELKSSGQLYTDENKESAENTLKSVMGSVKSDDITQNLIASTGREISEASVNRTLERIVEINNDPARKSELINKFPPDQQAKIDNLLSNHELLGEIKNQIISDPSAATPEVLAAFNFAEYLVDTAENGDATQIKALLDQPLPGSNMIVSDGIEHMDKMFNHLNGLNGDNEAKAIYAKGLMAYFGQEAFAKGVSVEDAWNNFETGTMTGPDGNEVAVKEAVKNEILQKLGQTSSGQMDLNEMSLDEKLEALKKNDYLDGKKEQIQLLNSRGGTTSMSDSLLLQYAQLENRRVSGDDINPDEYTQILDQININSRTNSSLSASQRGELRELEAAVRTSQSNATQATQLVNGIDRPSDRSLVADLFTQAQQEVDDSAEFANEFIGTYGGRLDELNPGSSATFSHLIGSANLDSEGVQEGIALLQPLKDSPNIEDQMAHAEGLTALMRSSQALMNVQGLSNMSKGNTEGLGQNFAISDVLTAVPSAIAANPSGRAYREWSELQLEILQGHLSPEQIQSRLRTFGSNNHIDDPVFAKLAGGGVRERADLVDSTTERIKSDPGLQAFAATQSDNLMAHTVDTYAEISLMDIEPAETLQNLETVDFMAGVGAASQSLSVNMAENFEVAEATGDYTLANALNGRLRENMQEMLESKDAMYSAMSQLTGEPFTPLSDQYRAEEGLPVSDIAAKSAMNRAAGAEAEARAAVLVEEANSLANKLVLAPKGQDSTELLSDLINGFINTIRDQDYKTRQLVMAQLANQMMTDSITHFYKDKTDKNNKYHQDSIERMADSFQRNIQRTIQESLVNSASDNQTIAAVSGQVGAANTAEAMGLEQLRVSTEQMINEAQKMTPPLITDIQKERILSSLFDSNPNNDALGIVALAGLPALN